jgi:hypothetical protein
MSSLPLKAERNGDRESPRTAKRVVAKSDFLPGVEVPQCM